MAQGNISNVRPPLSYRRGCGLLVSTSAQRPETALQKITCARSIVQAIVTAEADGELVNVGHVLPFLTMATAFLEEAAAEVGGLQAVAS
jgi:hypothetical protein